MPPSQAELWHGTTILAVRRNGKVVVAGDGQVSFGNTVLKGTARKVRRIGDLPADHRHAPCPEVLVPSLGIDDPHL